MMNPNHFQHRMTGNVMLYNMNTNAIIMMLERQLILQPAIQLASVLAITYVGRKKLPKSWLKSTFRVHHWIIYEALVWLKANNKIYSNIDISAEQLASLPEDDIPLEILAVVRHEEQDEVVDCEYAGYVPSNEVIEGDFNLTLEVS